MSNLKVLTEKDFDATIGNGVTLVDFYADWCGPCKRQTPILEKIAEGLGDKALIVKLNVDHAGEIFPGRFGVSSIPTLILFKAGEEVERFVGLQDQRTIESAIAGHI